MKEETLTPKVMTLNVTLKKTDVDSFPCDKDSVFINRLSKNLAIVCRIFSLDILFQGGTKASDTMFGDEEGND